MPAPMLLKVDLLYGTHCKEMSLNTEILTQFLPIAPALGFLASPSIRKR
jgi:hypothetical protein